MGLGVRVGAGVSVLWGRKQHVSLPPSSVERLCPDECRVTYLICAGYLKLTHLHLTPNPSYYLACIFVCLSDRYVYDSKEVKIGNPNLNPNPNPSFA